MGKDEELPTFVVYFMSFTSCNCVIYVVDFLQVVHCVGVCYSSTQH